MSKNERHSIAYKKLIEARQEYNHIKRMIEADRICLVDAESDPWCSECYVNSLEFELSVYRDELRNLEKRMKYWKKEIKSAQSEYHKMLNSHETR